MKGLRVPKSNKSTHNDSNPIANLSHLDDIFMRNPIQEPLSIIDEADELTIGGTFLFFYVFHCFQFLCICSDAILFNLFGSH